MSLFLLTGHSLLLGSMSIIVLALGKNCGIAFLFLLYMMPVLQHCKLSVALHDHYRAGE